MWVTNEAAMKGHAARAGDATKGSRTSAQTEQVAPMRTNPTSRSVTRWAAAFQPACRVAAPRTAKVTPTEIPLTAAAECVTKILAGDLIGRPQRAAARRVNHNGGMSDIPKWAISRSAKLASLPIGLAGRTALGFGKRIGGRPAEIVASELQQRTAEQLFKVLGELKGGAMKFGQALSVFEAALPEELASPYRAALTKLQDAAPPMPAQTVQRVLAQGLGPDWRENFQEWNDQPAAAASIGQVHRAIWHDGREVAVKLQYPGAGNALLSDLNQLARLARLFAVVNPGLDVKPLIAELKVRVAEELDYSLEAASQSAFAEAYDGDLDIFVPKVVQQSGNVLVTEWIDGTPLSAIIADGAKTGARPRRAAVRPVPVLRARPGRAAARRPPPRQLPDHCRRKARRARLRRGEPAAGRVAGRHRPVGPARTRGSRPGRARRVARGGFRPARPRGRRPGGSGLRPADAGPGHGGDVPLHPHLATAGGRPGRRPAVTGQRAGSSAEPSPDVPAHPSGHARRHRGALPARR